MFPSRTNHRQGYLLRQACRDYYSADHHRWDCQVDAGLTANIFGQTLKLLGFLTYKEAERIFNLKLKEYMQQTREQITEQSKNN